MDKNDTTLVIEGFCRFREETIFCGLYNPQNKRMLIVDMLNINISGTKYCFVTVELPLQHKTDPSSRFVSNYLHKKRTVEILNKYLVAD